MTEQETQANAKAASMLRRLADDFDAGRRISVGVEMVNDSELIIERPWNTPRGYTDGPYALRVVWRTPVT